jgi:transposase
MGKAIDYVLKRWKELNYYLENGALPIDNNAAERSLRTMVMGRKNYLCVSRRRICDENLNFAA